MSDSELDPSIAALLQESNTATHPGSLPSFDDIAMKSGDERKTDDTDEIIFDGGVPRVNLNIKEFKPIKNFFNDTPSSLFDDPAYYKTALTGEDESAQRLHSVLAKYLRCSDPKDRVVYRQRIRTSWWDLIRSLCIKMNNPGLPLPKRMLLRYGVLLPSLFTPEQKKVFSSAILENRTGEPVFYVDEWFQEINAGHLKLSVTDEVRPSKRAENSAGSSQEQLRLIELQSKNSGKLQSAENYVAMKESERALLETELKSRVDMLCEHQPFIGLEPHKMSYSETQKRLFMEITERLRALSKNDKELSVYLKDYQEAKAVAENLGAKIAQGPDIVQVDKSDVYTEFETVRQMEKMTVGRQGNQFPILTREFYHCIPQGTGFRENVIDQLAWVESIDPGAFCRIHKNIPNRIVPFVLLVPTYGDSGFCWEPFDRYNRITSRGRIVVPMYPRDLRIAVLTAVADLRWQVAKEKASYYWMEEGITGQYYQWFDRQKIKGDLKAYFISDYILWMTKESEGIQRLDKEVRGIFWRNMPFPDQLREKLRRRSLVYNELYQKDINRSLSDGY